VHTLCRNGETHLRIARALSIAAILAIELAARPLPAADAMPATNAGQGATGSRSATVLDWVNTYIGTGSSGFGGSDYGGTMPFVTTPFGMTNWTAQTRENRISVSSYAFEDDTISGFIGTHQPAIWMGDYGYVTLTPEVDSVKLAPDARKLRFRRSDEVTTPYYYSVLMDAGDARHIRAEITATDHCGFLRFTFPARTVASIVVEATRPRVEGFVHVDARANEIVGYNPDRMDTHLINLQSPNFKGYFVARFNRSFKAHGVYLREAAEPGGDEATGPNVGGYASFDTAAGQVVEMTVATSFISIEQARANLKAEIPDWNFDAARSRLKELWKEKLARFVLEGASDDQKRIFYTGLYHALLYPKLFSEHGRYYSAFDDRVHDGVSYTAYSLWDTFRAENSLLTLIAPERIDDMVRALLQDFREGGWMPKWPNPSYTNIMIATHADAVVAEAMSKGFHGFDYGLAWQAVYKDAMTPPDGDTRRDWHDREPDVPYEARPGLTYYKKLGYVPLDKTAESASETLEDAFDDFAVAQVARIVGRDADYRFFIERSRNYRNIYNPRRGFMQARRADGSWGSPEDGWTEGDQWVYTYSVLHDIAGLMALVGGPDRFNARLDEHFAGGHNRHDNEPSHHYGYLYDFSGQPWKTQSRVRQIARDYYRNEPNGIAGNEDCGQMSAWYIFTALGFYPLNPVSGDYMIGSPLFRKVTVELPNGKRLVVSAPKNSETNLYIQGARLNGTPLDVPLITYAQIEAGGLLEFDMGPSPSQWASKWRAIPLPASGER
jgi:predicted alpha-1,2-mannosidase